MAWEFDTAHAQIEFSARHMMVTTVRGRFNKWAGTIELDENNPSASKVNVQIEAASIDTNQEQRDGHLRSADFLDVDNYPYITFVSTHVEEPKDNQFKVTGDLTIHGVTRPVTLDAEVNGPVKDMRGGRRASFNLTTSISRKDFGLNWNVALESGGWLVSDKVNITIEAPAVEPVAAATETANA